MNERIKELEIEAGKHATSIVSADDVDYDYNWDEEFRKKFAELIVEDIMQELFVNGYEDAFNFLNEYFGIEK